MSSRARRVVQSDVVVPFAWGGAPVAGDGMPPAMRSANPTVPARDPGAGSGEQLAAIERDAFAKGYAQGERAGAEAAAQRGDAMLRRLTQTLEELTALRSDMIRQTERQMVQLALAVARRVVHREVSLDPDLLVAMARVALERLGESATVTVRLHPEEFEAIGAGKARLDDPHVTVVGDVRVGRGGCRIESDFGTLDAGVDAQMQELARALLGEETAHASERVVG